jgi:hypothetical protein
VDNKQHLKIPIPLRKADKHHESGCSPVLVTSWPIKPSIVLSSDIPEAVYTNSLIFTQELRDLIFWFYFQMVCLLF